MATCSIERITCEAETGQLRALAAKHLDASTAWLLAETPEKVFFQPFEEDLPENAMATAFSVIIFGPAAEIRFERQPGQERGQVRIMAASDAGEQYLGINREALLRDEKDRLKYNGRLEYMEYFTESESGFLRKVGSRLVNVHGRKR